MVPHRTPFFLPLLFPRSLVWRYADAQRNLYLTFDDGPVQGPTDFVLDELSKRNVSATFFCIGDNVLKYPGVYKRIIENGHGIGNHTFNHLNGWKTGTDEYVRNVTDCDGVLGTARKIFRPPYGRITRKQIDALSDYKIVMWDVLSIDYDNALDRDKCLRNTIKATRTGSVIVFHDSFKAEKNLTYVLPRYLDYFLDNGYDFKIIT